MKREIVLKKSIKIAICAIFLFLSGLTRILAKGDGNAERLTWTEAVDILLKNNPQSISAKYSLEISRSRLDYSKASLFPQLSASGSYDRSGSSIYNYSYSYGLSLSQPLFAPALNAETRKARWDIKKAESGYELVKNNLIFKLAQIFSKVAYAKDFLLLSEEILKRRAKNVEIIKLKYQAGRESKAALLETAAIEKNALWEHEKYRKDFILAERELNKLLNKPARVKIKIGKLPKSPVPPENFKNFSGRVAFHPALESKRFVFNMARESVSEAKSSRFPASSVNGNYNWSGYDWPNSLPGWSAGISLSWSLYTGGKNSSSIISSELAQKNILAELEDLKNDMYVKAEDKFLSWKLAYAYVKVVKSSLEALRARNWLVREKYLTGQTSYFEWSSVEEQLINAKKRLLSAENNLRISYAAFLNSLGIAGEYK